MDSDSSDTNLVIVTRRYRFVLFCKLYWRSVVFLVTPLVLLPVALIGDHNNAYPVFYVFLVCAVYWSTDVLHPSVISMVPLACFSIIGTIEMKSINQIYVRNGLLDCLGIMMIMTAIECSQVHKRIALKLLLLVGCSHYRLSLVLFFSSMLLSMWMSNTVACGLMMPLVKAMLQALEKMGIIEMYQTVGKADQKSRRHEMSNPRPTEITMFYFLGIAHSCSIEYHLKRFGKSEAVDLELSGLIVALLLVWPTSNSGLLSAEMMNEIFPNGPKIEFPQYMLLHLPGMVVMETLLYLWLNSYFLKLFRTRSDLAIQPMTEEETQYIKSLLENQYLQLGKITFHDIVVAITVLLVIVFQITSYAVLFDVSRPGVKEIYTHLKISAPSVACVLILFAAPRSLDFLKFFKRKNGARNEPLPTAPSKACLNWDIVRANVLWSVLFMIGGSCMTVEALKQSGMTAEFGRALRAVSNWPPCAVALIVILFCKTMTEFASNSCVAYSLLPEVALLSVEAKIHPHFLMLAATLGSSMPFHLVVGTPAIAMVSQYVHISTWKIVPAGVGPSIAGILVSWWTAAVWAKVVWGDAGGYPAWAGHAFV